MENTESVDSKVNEEKKIRKKKEVREGTDLYQPPQLRRSLGKAPAAPKPTKTRHSVSGVPGTSGIYVPPQVRKSRENLATSVQQCRSEPKKNGRKTPTNTVEAGPSTSTVNRSSPIASPISRPAVRTAKGRGIPKTAQQQAKKHDPETKKPDDEASVKSSSLSIDESSPSKRIKRALSKSPPKAQKTISSATVISPTVSKMAANKEIEKPVVPEPVKSSPSPAPVISSSQPTTSSTSQRPLRSSTIKVKAPWENENWREKLGVKKSEDKRMSLKLITPSIETEEMEGKEKTNGNAQNRAKTLPAAPISNWRKTISPVIVKPRAGGCCSDEEMDPETMEPTEQVESAVKFIDSHCHLDFLWSKLNGGGLAKWMNQYPDAFPDNFEGCIPNFIQPNLFVDGEEFAKTCDRDWIHEEVKNRYVLGASYGVHPHYSNGYSQKIEEGVRMMLVNRHETKAIAVGECGFDFFKSSTSKEDQIRSFHSQLMLAVEQELPVIIHCRGSNDDPDYAETLCLEVMEKVLPSDHIVHRHCFTQSWTTAQKWISKFPNTFFGFTSGIAKGGFDLSAVKNVPLDKMLLETDAPYFRPTSFYGKKTGPKNLSFPGMAIAVSDVIAKARNISVDEVITSTRRNTLKCYKIRL